MRLRKKTRSLGRTASHGTDNKVNSQARHDKSVMTFRNCYFCNNLLYIPLYYPGRTLAEERIPSPKSAVFCTSIFYPLEPTRAKKYFPPKSYFPEWFPYDARMMPEWYPNDTRMMPEWYPNDNPNDARMMPEQCLNDIQMTPKWYSNDAKMMPTWYPIECQMMDNDQRMSLWCLKLRMMSKLYLNDAQILSEWSPNVMWCEAAVKTQQ